MLVTDVMVAWPPPPSIAKRLRPASWHGLSSRMPHVPSSIGPPSSVEVLQPSEVLDSPEVTRYLKYPATEVSTCRTLFAWLVP
eukprot:scaffold20179_cov72-Phaeocystis_antarctica.AAC.5